MWICNIVVVLILFLYCTSTNCVYVKRQVEQKNEGLKQKYDKIDMNTKEIVSKESVKYSNVDLVWHLERQNKFLYSKYNSALDNQTHNDCEYSVAIVLDTSASSFLPLFGGKRKNIDLIKSSLYKSIEKLKGFNINLALYSFATHSRQETDGYVNMRSNYALDSIRKVIGHGQNWNQDGGSGIKFSENPHDILTNWEDALIKVYETSHHLSKGYVDFIIFITDGNPNTRNNVKLYGKTDISAALDQAHHMLGDENRKTKIIPISISHGCKEEYIRALTCLPSPQIGQDYFHTQNYETFEDTLGYVIERETCCDKYRDTCGVCKGDSSVCKKTHFKTWSDIYMDKDFENSYDEQKAVPDKTNLYVSIESLAQQELDKHVQHTLYENSYTKYDQFYGSKNHHKFKPMIEKVMFCFSKRGKLLPYDSKSPSHTGCNTKNINIEICVLYHEEKLAHCYTKYQYSNNNNNNEKGKKDKNSVKKNLYTLSDHDKNTDDKSKSTLLHKEKPKIYNNDYYYYDYVSLTKHMTPKQIQDLYNFQWMNQDKTAFKFRARALALHSQSVHVHWKLVYSRESEYDSKKYNNVRKKHQQFVIATKKHHAYLENMDEYDFSDYVRPNGTFNGIFTTHYSIKEHAYYVECIDKHKEESFDLSQEDDDNRGSSGDDDDDDDDIYYDYIELKCVFGKRKRMKTLAFNIILTFSICLALVFIACLINFINRVSRHRKQNRIKKTDERYPHVDNEYDNDSKHSYHNNSYSQFTNQEEIDHIDDEGDIDIDYDDSLYNSDNENDEFISVLIPEKEEKKTLIDEVIDFLGISDDINNINGSSRGEENSKFE